MWRQLHKYRKLSLQAFIFGLIFTTLLKRCQKCSYKAKLHSIICYSPPAKLIKLPAKRWKNNFSAPAALHPVWQPRSTPIWLAQMNKISLRGSSRDHFKRSVLVSLCTQTYARKHKKAAYRLCMCVLLLILRQYAYEKGHFALAHTPPGRISIST